MSARPGQHAGQGARRAHRWQHMLESGEYRSIAELAAAERINASYLARVLRLTLLSPNVVEAILGGRGDEAEHAEDVARLIDWQAQTQRYSKP
jgi:hypothetical protein